MNFRRLDEKDIKLFISLYIHCFNSEPWLENWDELKVLERFQAFMSARHCLCYGMFLDDELLGVSLGDLETYDDGYHFCLKEFFVSDSKRGLGLGTKMFAFLEETLKAYDIKEIYLWTKRGHLTEGFYKKQGFVSDDGLVVMTKEYDE